MIIQLPKEFKKYGDTFKLLTRNKGGFLYERLHGSTKYYEVFKAKKGKQHPSMNTKVKKYRYPSDESFGLWAWCCRDKAKAVEILTGFAINQRLT